MTHRKALFALLLAVGACQSKLPDATHATAASAKPASVRPSEAAPAKPVAPQLLQTAGDTVALTGDVLLDAAYARAHGAKALTGALGLDGAQIIGNDGASLANAGGQIVAQGGGNVIVPATLITNDGGSLITNDGGSLITNDGGSIVAQGGGNYALMQADGGTLPAAGMWVSVIDLRTGVALPLGNDAAGNPVRAIYSDAKGHFTVHLPAAVAKNVRVVARAPGQPDPRLHLQVVTPVQGGSALKVDGTNAIATAYLRDVLAIKLLQLVNAEPSVVSGYFLKVQASSQGARATTLKNLIEAPLNEVKDAFRKVHAEQLPPQRQLELSILASDRLLADIDLAALEVDYQTYAPKKDTVSGLGGLGAVDTFRIALDVIAAQAGEDASKSGSPSFAAFIGAKPYVRAANMLRPACAPFTFQQPSDFAAFIVKTYLSGTDDRTLDVLDHVFYDLGVAIEQRDRIRGAGVGIFLALAFQMANDQVATQMAQQIALAGAQMNKAPAPAPGAQASCLPAGPPGPTPDPIGTVTTLAGATAGGNVDGAGAVARFSTPMGIVADPAANPPILYVADQKNNAVRRLRLDATGAATVDTLALGADAVSEPLGLALGPDGTLYVSEPTRHAIRRITLAADGSAKSTTLLGPDDRLVAPGPLVVDPAGERLLVGDERAHGIWQINLKGGTPQLTPLTVVGVKGDLDAPAAKDAQVGQPGGLVFAPDGTLFIAQGTGYVRRIAAPATPQSATSFVAGFGDRSGEFDGYWSNAVFHIPHGLVVDPGGRLIIADTQNHRIRALTQDGWATTLAGAGPTGISGTYADGKANVAHFSRPRDVALAPDHKYYVTDEGNNCIRRFAP
ncbi:MAG: repeat containing protein [Cyanobacteria bacterium RYN_339]|nr:repeat containing protein [Cyanobacteria bacterium RYN_339]